MDVGKGSQKDHVEIGISGREAEWLSTIYGNMMEASGSSPDLAQRKSVAYVALPRKLRAGGGMVYALA